MEEGRKAHTVQISSNDNSSLSLKRNKAEHCGEEGGGGGR